MFICFQVKVELFYEALCPGCQAFITGPLAKVMGLPDIVGIIDLKMVPYVSTLIKNRLKENDC